MTFDASLAETILTFQALPRSARRSIAPAS